MKPVWPERTQGTHEHDYIALFVYNLRKCKQMKYTWTKRILLLFVIAGLLSCSNSDDPAKKPNIILILVDDMGFSDPGFMGSGIETPNIDKLAREGLMFSRFYNTGRCCPTRASLLTGLYAHNTGLGWMTVSNLGAPGYTGDMNDRCITIAQALKQADYSTYMTGKLHIMYDDYMKADGPKHNWPLQRGFDRYYGHLSGGGGYYNPETLTYNNERIEAPEEFYLTTAITDSTVSFLENHFKEKKDRPFFFYVAYYAPHRPLHALRKDISKYRGKFMDGWDEHRKRRYEKLVEIGFIDSAWSLSDRDPSVPAWEDLTGEERQIWEARMAVYAAQMDCMDQGIGDIISTIERHGALDNTMIVFLSDNGGCAEGQGGRLSLEQLPLLGNERPAQSYRIHWANVSNTPFRMYKHYNHEGGIATPMIVYWPEKIRSGGRITDQVGHVIDLMPTILDVAGVEYPSEFNGKPILPVQGMSLVTGMTGDAFERGPLFFEHEAHRAVIDGKWKLVSIGTREAPYEGPWELYDISADRTETVDLIGEQPQIAEELRLLWEKWAEENHVYPLNGLGWGDRIKADVTGKR
ncbi:MAG: arylsulfatase [Cytophagales bacterium]|nr:arylsulfatase [Cytophagales bacterium]